MAERITFNIKNVHVAKKMVSDTGVVTFGVPVALPGAKEISLPPVGEKKKVYADGAVYVTLGTNQGYDGNLSIYNIPDWFSRDYLGMTIDSNGALIESASGVQSEFALIFEFDTDTANSKRNVLYNCTAGRTDLNGATKEETVDPQAFSIPIVASPLEGTEYVKASKAGNSTDATWASWLSSVYTPALTKQYKVTVTVTGIANALVVCGNKFAHTDASGNAYFMLPSGTYDIMVSATGKTAQVSTVVVASADIAKTITMV